MARIAIHGFGRIGRSLMKAALKDGLFTPVAVSDIKDLRTLAALFEADTQLRALARRRHGRRAGLRDRRARGPLLRLD